MCFYEDDLPKNILKIEIGEGAIAEVAHSALIMSAKQWKDVLKTFAVVERFGLKSEDFKKISSVFENHNTLCKNETLGNPEYKGQLVKYIWELYPVFANAETFIKESDDVASISQRLAQVRKLRECLNLYFLWSLFDLLEFHEAMYFFPMNMSEVFKIFSFACEVAINSLAENPSQKMGLENAREFFADIEKCLTSKITYNELAKRYKKYDNELFYLKRAIKRSNWK